MLRRLWWCGLLIAVAAAVVLAACDTPGGGHRTQPPGPSDKGAVTVGSAQLYVLSTHCGIDEARIGSGYFEAVHPLSDGQGNPPAGWGNPFQRGTMTLLSPSKAVFRDDAGHRMMFRLRPGAASFKRLCD
ncbi:MAG: hypothetical protein LBV34_15305 [Nocardiopsaceae bacterium]|jgi:hypothetical protein|nr:hypothetical protein [Nocardiopsaceae bacterium]